MMWRAFTYVFVLTILMACVITSGIFDRVFTELGTDHYAEVAQGWAIFPDWMTMPFNTLINFIYVAVGSIWLAKTCNSVDDGTLADNTSFMFYIFNWLAIFYGPIQCLRIITQLHFFAIFDQWYTLPFFMWAVVWCVSVNTNEHKLTIWFPLMLFSLLTYCLAIFYTDGFECALAIHIVLALISTIATLMKNRHKAVVANYIMLGFSVLGFVALKLLDLYLPTISPVFTVVTGHFLSKIADNMQIYFANEFFLAILTHKRMKLENDAGDAVKKIQ